MEQLQIDLGYADVDEDTGALVVGITLYHAMANRNPTWEDLAVFGAGIALEEFITKVLKQSAVVQSIAAIQGDGEQTMFEIVDRVKKATYKNLLESAATIHSGRIILGGEEEGEGESEDATFTSDDLRRMFRGL